MDRVPNNETKKDSYESSPILVTTEMIRDFCELTGDTQDFHLNEETAGDSFFGGVASPGAFTTALGIKSMWEMHTQKNIFPGHEVLNLSCAAKYSKPVMAGDMIRFHWELKNQMDTKINEKDAVICKWEVEVFNQNQETVATHSWMFGYIKPTN